MNIIGNKPHFILILILFIIGYFLLMFGNGIVSLTHPDEVFYIQSAYEMVQHHKWCTPMIFDHVQFEKPFVSFMLFAAAIKWFGLNPFVARFWPAFFGLIGLGVTYWLAWLLFQRKRLAFLSGLILGSSFIYLALSRAVLIDMIFTVLVEISLAFFYLGYSQEKHRTLGYLLGFSVSAVAVLTKGLLGIGFPLVIFLLFALPRKELTVFVREKSFWLGIALFLVLSLPWHIAMYLKYGAFFIEEYFFNVHFRRLLMAEHARLDNWYFYLMLMFVAIMPWSLYWIPTIKNIVKSFREKLDDTKQISFCLSWILGVYLLMQPAHCKLASYIFPMFPGIAVLLAYTLDNYLSRNDQSRGLITFCGYGLSLMLVVVSIGGAIVARNYIHILFNLTPIYIFAACLFAIAVIIFVLNKLKKHEFMIYAHVLVTVVLLVALFFAKPYVEPWVSCKEVSDNFKKIDQSDSIVIASKFYVRGVRFYTQRKMAVIDINGKGFWSPHFSVPFLNTDQKVVDLLKTQPVTYAVVKESNVDDLKRIVINNPGFKLEELGGRAGKYILRITHKSIIEK